MKARREALQDVKYQKSFHASLWLDSYLTSQVADGDSSGDAEHAKTARGEHIQWLSKHPTLSGLGFILAGAGGLLAYPIYLLKGNRVVRFAAAGVLVAAAVIWAITGYGAYWDHMESFSQWSPGGPA